MSKVISTIHLFSLSVDRRGDIHMNASRNFFEVLRSKLGARVGSTLRVGTFDFCEVRKSQFVGIADERNAASLEEAKKLASHILSVYRSTILFEKVFAEPNSYETFVMFNHRAPSFQEIQRMARDRKIYVPFMELPYKADLSRSPVALATVITESEPVKKLGLPQRAAQPTTMVATAKLNVPAQKARVLLQVRRSPDPAKLNALTEKFGRSIRVS